MLTSNASTKRAGKARLRRSVFSAMLGKPPEDHSYPILLLADPQRLPPTVICSLPPSISEFERWRRQS